MRSHNTEKYQVSLHSWQTNGASVIWKVTLEGLVNGYNTTAFYHWQGQSDMPNEHSLLRTQGCHPVCSIRPWLPLYQRPCSRNCSRCGHILWQWTEQTNVSLVTKVLKLLPMFVHGISCISSIINLLYYCVYFYVYAFHICDLPVSLNAS